VELLSIQISQGNVVTHLWSGENFCNGYVTIFYYKSDSERIVKIG